MGAILVRSWGSTQFLLYWSHVNQCFIFVRNDVGTDTETKLLECNNSDEAQEYFYSRVGFYCEVMGITLDQMGQ